MRTLHISLAFPSPGTSLPALRQLSLARADVVVVVAAGNGGDGGGGGSKMLRVSNYIMDLIN